MKVYQIREWNKYYENNRTRDLKNMAWIPVPNAHDGDGYTTLVSRENGAAMLGAWLAILQVASKCDPRGTLLRRGKIPHDAESLSRITRLPSGILSEALTICSVEIQWLEYVEVTEIPQEGAGFPQEGAPKPQGPDDEGTGREGTEKKGMDGGEIPTLTLCQEYASNPAWGFPSELVEEWFNKSSDRGWGQDWRARMRGAVATYRGIQNERNQKNGRQSKYSGATSNQPSPSDGQYDGFEGEVISTVPKV